jgi:hypothetical protein
MIVAVNLTTTDIIAKLDECYCFVGVDRIALSCDCCNKAARID